MVAALVCAAAVACDSSAPGPNAGTASPSAATTTSAATSGSQAAPTTTSATEEAKDVDYARLLLQGSDISDAEDTFTIASTNPGPTGLPGASALFVNQDDTRAIADTIVIYPDADTAAKTLRDALPTIDTVITGATTRPVPVGTGGTMAVGTSADEDNAITLLLFTEGPALVRLEFQSAPGDTTTDDYVINVGKMQLIALRTGLDQSQ